MASAVIKSEFSQLAPIEKFEIYEKTSVARQWISALTMDLLAFSYGATCGWPSASLPLLKSDDTSLESGPITTNEASWIASGMCIGGFFGNLFIGWLSTRIGQKFSLCLVSVPQILSWLFIYYAKSPFYLITSRVLAGIAGGGLYAVIPSYISEISDDRVRGALGSTVVFSCNLGLFFAFFCGEYFDYLTVPWLMIPATLIFLVFFVKVPDSPTFFAKRNLYEV
jgi:MFS family permease